MKEGRVEKTFKKQNEKSNQSVIWRAPFLRLNYNYYFLEKLVYLPTEIQKIRNI